MFLKNFKLLLSHCLGSHLSNVIADLHSEHVHRETSGGHIPLGGYAPYVLWNLYFFLDLAISCRSEIASEFLKLWRTNSRTSNGRLEFVLCLLYEPDIWHNSGFLLGVNEILMHSHINAQCVYSESVHQRVHVSNSSKSNMSRTCQHNRTSLDTM